MAPQLLPLLPLLLLLLLLLPPFCSFHGVFAAAILYQAGNAQFSTQSNASNSSSSSSSSSSAFWLSENGTLTFGFKTLGPNQYLLCIWMTQDTNRTPLWWPSMNDSVVTQGSTLTFTSKGNLELSDANQSLLWNTSASNASFARLEGTGNLQLLSDDTMENIIWQSFLDLRDSLIVRPRDNKSTNPLSSIVTDKPYLLRSRQNDTFYASPGRFYVGTDVNQNVYQHAVDIAHNVDFIYLYAHLNASDDFFELTRDYGKTYKDNSSMPRSMLRLDPDGGLRIYAWNTSYSTWSMVWEFIDDKCMLGSPCGPYSICEEDTDGSLNCTCPVGYQAVDTRDVSLGCYNSLNLSTICDGSGGNTSNGLFYMAENQKSDYNYNDIASSSADDVEECKQHCLDNCDCIAASYRLNDGECFLKGNSDTWLLMNGYATDGNTLLMKLLVPPSNTSLPPSNDGGVKKGEIIGAVVAVIVTVMLVVIAIVTWRTKKARGHGCGSMMFGMLRGHEHGVMMSDAGPIRFTYQQLVMSTRNFSEFLGEGAFGKVYKGRILVVTAKGRKADEKELPVAVKVLKNGTMGAGPEEAEKQFRAEVRTLGNIHHNNLVNLLGYCIGGRGLDMKILVYEFVENGSLSEFLSEEKEPLPWAVRYSIAVGTARGIAYLHHDCNPHILHCDIKPQNVLLDHDFTVKVADFGLAKQLEEVKSHLTMSHVRGTRGYMAPEWLKTDEITSKADVYSYGMVLLELVRGFHDRGSDGDSVVDWAYQFILSIEEENTGNKEEHPHSCSPTDEHDHEKMEILNGEEEVSQNNRLRSDELSQKTRLLQIGLWCVQYQPDLRPSMLRILQLLEGNGDQVGIPPYPAMQRLPLLHELSSSTSTNTIQSYASEALSAFSAR